MKMNIIKKYANGIRKINIDGVLLIAARDNRITWMKDWREIDILTNMGIIDTYHYTGGVLPHTDHYLGVTYTQAMTKIATLESDNAALVLRNAELKKCSGRNGETRATKLTEEYTLIVGYTEHGDDGDITTEVKALEEQLASVTAEKERLKEAANFLHQCHNCGHQMQTSALEANDDAH